MYLHIVEFKFHIKLNQKWARGSWLVVGTSRGEPTASALWLGWNLWLLPLLSSKKMVAAMTVHVVSLFKFSCPLVEVRNVSQCSRGEGEKYLKGPRPQKWIHHSVSAVLGENPRKGSHGRGTRPKGSSIWGALDPKTECTTQWVQC